MAIPEKVGHDRRGNPVYVTTPDGEVEVDTNAKPVIDDHLPVVAQVFKEWARKKGMA